MKKIILGFLISFLLIPTISNAEVLSKETKYYKTITTIPYYDITKKDNVLSSIYEISEEEYNNSNNQTSTRTSSQIVETTYKKMTTSISKNGNNYRLKNELVWKNIPKTRSYDIIGIGFYSNVKPTGNIKFSQYYCIENETCTTTNTNYPQTFSNGVGTTFKIPSGALSTLKQTLYFDITKNTSSTLTNISAFGDYSHATKTISLTNAKKYSMSVYGIELTTSITEYYDTIDRTIAELSVNW